MSQLYRRVLSYQRLESQETIPQDQLQLRGE